MPLRSPSMPSFMATAFTQPSPVSLTRNSRSPSSTIMELPTDSVSPISA
jgi:hypothetical protein